MKLITMFDKPYTEAKQLSVSRYDVYMLGDNSVPTSILLQVLEYYFSCPMNILYDLVDNIEDIKTRSEGIISTDEFDLAFATVSSRTNNDLIQLAMSSMFIQSIFEELINRGICLSAFLDNIRKAELEWQVKVQNVSPEVETEPHTLQKEE